MQRDNTKLVCTICGKDILPHGAKNIKNKYKCTNPNSTKYPFYEEYKYCEGHENYNKGRNRAWRRKWKQKHT